MSEDCEMRLKEAGKISRLTNKTFKFDPRIADGYYSANYFLRSRQIVLDHAPGHIVTEQWFQRRDDTMVVRT
jgi:nicotinate phosphoribosyltransferase